jgi:hypothetical protein
MGASEEVQRGHKQAGAARWWHAVPRLRVTHPRRTHAHDTAACKGRQHTRPHGKHTWNGVRLGGR